MKPFRILFLVALLFLAWGVGPARIGATDLDDPQLPEPPPEFPQATWLNSPPLKLAEVRMYQLVKNTKWGKHLLKLAPNQAALQIYSFPFTSCPQPVVAGKLSK